VAFDAVTADQVEDEIGGAPDDLGQARTTLGAQQRLELTRIELQPRNHLAAVAAGGAGADLARFQHDHGGAALREMQRGREPRESATDHADVDSLVTLVLRAGRRGRRRRGPESRGQLHEARTGWGWHWCLGYSKKPADPQRGLWAARVAQDRRLG